MLLGYFLGGVKMYEHLKEIIYDDDLSVEAYQFDGVVQTFPNHFHDYYVVGLMETGKRKLIVNQQRYHIGPGDLMTFNPMDSHTCEQVDGVLRYLCLNIKQEIMQNVANEVFDCNKVPLFVSPVQFDGNIAEDFRSLHHSIMENDPSIEKEEKFLLFMKQLFVNYASFKNQHHEVSVRNEIRMVCDFLNHHYDETITLDVLSQLVKLNKYSLVRLFTRQMGISPYRYLETIRIGEAKKLLEQGKTLVQVAQLTGFSDQSHFSKYFSRFIGLSPGQYQAIFKEDKKV